MSHIHYCISMCMSCLSYYCISLLVKPLFYIQFLNQAFQLINFLTVNEKKIQKIVPITFTYFLKTQQL